MTGDCPICKNNAGKWEKVGPPYWHRGGKGYQDYVCSTRGCRYVATKLIGDEPNGRRSEETSASEKKAVD